MPGCRRSRPEFPFLNRTRNATFASQPQLSASEAFSAGLTAVCPRGSRAPLGKLGVTQQIRAGALSSAVKTPGVRWESSARSAVRPSVRPPEQPCGTAAPHRTAPRHSGPAAPPGAPTAARCSVLRSVPRRSPQPPPLRGGPQSAARPGAYGQDGARTRRDTRFLPGTRRLPLPGQRSEGRRPPQAGPFPAAALTCRARPRRGQGAGEAAPGAAGGGGGAERSRGRRAGRGRGGPGGAALSSWRGRRKCRVPGRENGVGAQQ